LTTTNEKITELWIQYLKDNQIVSMQSDPKTGKLNYKRSATVKDLENFLRSTGEFEDEAIQNAIQSTVGGKSGDEPEPGKEGEKSDAEQGKDNKFDNKEDVIPATEADRAPPGWMKLTNSKIKDTPKPYRIVSNEQAAGWLQDGWVRFDGKGWEDLKHFFDEKGSPKPQWKPGDPMPASQGGNAEKEKQGSAAFGQMANQLQKNNSEENKQEKQGAGAFDQMARQLQANKKKPHFKLNPAQAGNKPKVSYKGLREAIVDKPPATIDEADVEKIFDMLAKGSADKEQDKGQEQAQGQAQDKSKKTATRAEKEAAIRKIKAAIRYNMTPSQIKSLYTSLKNQAVQESIITRADTSAILQAASELRNKPTMAGKLFKGLRKDKVDVADLQKAWIEDGRSNDTDDIYAILKKQFGFGDNEIKKVFSKVLGASHEEESDNSAIDNIADFAKEHGIADVLIKFLEDNYANEIKKGASTKSGAASMLKNIVLNRNPTMEEINQIFNDIVKEERTERERNIREQEHTLLGRNKK